MLDRRGLTTGWQALTTAGGTIAVADLTSWRHLHKIDTAALTALHNISKACGLIAEDAPDPMTDVVGAAIRSIGRCLPFYDPELRDLPHKMGAKTESPIEEAMFIALMRVGPSHLINFEFDPENRDFEPSEKLSFVLRCQVPLGSFRPDFFIVASKGGDALCRLIVECDGYAFHDANDEQRHRDKKRDDIFRSAGFDVLRFTGSQIYHDAYGCAERVANHLIGACMA